LNEELFARDAETPLPLGAVLRLAGLALGLLAVMEMLAFAPSAGLLIPRVWLLEGLGTALLVLAVGLAAVGLARAQRALGLRAVSVGDLTLSLVTTLVVTGHLWRLGSQLLHKLDLALHVELSILGLAVVSPAAYATGRSLTARLGVPGCRSFWPLVATLSLPLVLLATLRAGATLDPGASRALLASTMTLAFGGAILVSLLAARAGRGAGPSVLALALALGVLRLVMPNPHDLLLEPAPPASGPGGPPVLFIVLDTFRSDALDLADPRVSETPHLARLGRDADVFPRAVANASWTLPGHASLFTGRYLASHRTDRTTEPGFAFDLAPSIPIVHETLAERGYRTVCYTASGFVGKPTRLSRGCQRYRNPGRAWVRSLLPLSVLRFPNPSAQAQGQLLLELAAIDVHATAREIVDLALAELRGEPDSLYLFLNFLDVHSPVYPPADRVETSLEERLSMRWDLVLLMLGAMEEAEFWQRNADRLLLYYRARARALDAELGRLFDALRARGWYDRTAIVVTSDHGEAFLENRSVSNYYLHHSAWEPVVRIPLLVKRPGQRVGAVSNRLAQQIDVFPTLLASLGLPIPEGVDGRPVAEVGDRRAITEWYARPSRAERFFPHRRLAVYGDGHKYVIEGDGSEHLFDLEASPYEESDVLQERSEVADRLRRELYERLQHAALRHPEGGESELLVLDQLEALGYAH
jgi:choline-sulfatase